MPDRKRPHETSGHSMQHETSARSTQKVSELTRRTVVTGLTAVTALILLEPLAFRMAARAQGKRNASPSAHDAHGAEATHGAQGAQGAQGAPQIQLSSIGQNGELRAAFILSEAGLVKSDRQGHLKGILVDIANALAAQTGLTLKPVPYENLVHFHQSIGKGDWDVALIPRDLSRISILAFSNPFLRVENGYVARPGSGLLSTDDVDRHGIKVAVLAHSAAAGYLSRNLQRAKLVRLPGGLSAAQDALSFGRADVFAGTMQNAHQVANNVPGSLVLAGYFSAVPMTIAVPKASAADLSAINGFIDRAEKDGTVLTAITSANAAGLSQPLPTLRNRRR